MQAIPTQIWFDDEVEEHLPELYQCQGLAETVKDFEAVTDSEIEFFHQQGYLAIRDAFEPTEIAGAVEGLLDLLEGKRPEFKGVQVEAGARDLLETLPREKRQDVVRKFCEFVVYDPRLKALSEKPQLLAVLEHILGGTPTMFQDMALLKPPRLGREKPWHQDLAYFNLPLDTIVVGVWIALDEAAIENGCMCIMPGSHRQGPLIHFQRRDWQICDSQVQGKPLAVPLPPGGCLLFHGLLHHGTPTNHSMRRRRALQFHYKPENAGAITQEERMAVFGSEGKEVRC